MSQLTDYTCDQNPAGHLRNLIYRSSEKHQGHWITNPMTQYGQFTLNFSLRNPLLGKIWRPVDENYDPQVFFSRPVLALQVQCFFA